MLLMKEEFKSVVFTRNLDIEEVPFYGKDYLCDEEIVLAAFATNQDIGIFTDQKIIIFDNTNGHGNQKEVISIPYQVLTIHSIMFQSKSVEIVILLDSKNKLTLKFIDLDDAGKMRIRYLYNAVSALVCGLDIPKKVQKKLLENDFKF